jgi:putative Mn2+ efflux pump MntP
MLLASFTGIFQGLMPVISYFMTNFVRVYIQPYSDLIVFLIFSYLGFKFIIEAYQKTGIEKQDNLCIDIKCLFLIGIATSIDAFSAGITLSLYGNHILKPAFLIAIITFINSNVGFFAGGKLKHLPAKNLEIFAGILLLILAAKAIF